MTQRIKVIARYRNPATSAQLSEGLLMCLHVADDNNIVTGAVAQLEQHDLVVKDILGVEIFTSLIEEETHSSIFLVTIREASTAKAERFSPGGNKEPWKLVREDGSVVRFKPDLELNLRVRSPLSWGKGKASCDPPYEFTESDDNDELRTSFEFKFKDKKIGGKEQANKDKCTHYKYVGDLSLVGGGTIEISNDNGFPLEDIFEVKQTVTTSHDDDEHLWAPGILRFDQFCTSDAPRGKHFWALRWAEIRQEWPKPDPDLPKLPDRYTKMGLQFDYNCVRSQQHPDSRTGWGKDEATASKLWPLGIAPLGNFATEADLPKGANLDQRTPDLSATQLWSDLRAADIARWQLKVNWKFDGVTDARSFTPLGAWNTLVAGRQKDSLRTVKGGAPASIVPRFEEPEKQGWEILYEIVDANPHVPFLREEGGDCFLRPEDFTFKLPKPKLSHLQLKAEMNPLKLVPASLVNFLNVKGEPIRRSLEMSLVVSGEDPEQPEDERGPQFLLNFKDKSIFGDEDRDAMTSRAGALDMLFGMTERLDGIKPGRIIATLQGQGNESRFDAEKREPMAQPPYLLGIKADDAIFKIDGFRPGDQDLTPLEDTRDEEKRPSSIIFKFPETDDNANKSPFLKGEFLLVVEETSDSNSSHKLVMRLESLKQPDDKDRSVDLVIIDTSPFLVARVQARVNLFSTGEVGNFTGDDPGGASWELKDPGEVGSFRLILPPQGIGEEFVKSYDAPPEPSNPLDYRFSPPAIFTLSRTPFKQSFSEAPWNLRRLLGFPGQRQPGMGVHSLSFELMYGLTATISADPEELKLTELAAITGRVPKPFDRDALPPFRTESSDKDFLTAAFADYVARYSKKLDLIKTRLALLQPRTAAQKSPFLTLERGVSFNFRCSRKVAHPFKRAVSSVDDCPKPKNLVGGLQGGVDWGFTSENIYNEVIGSRVSNSGKIVNPSFTALGGNGYQEAVFANGKSTLYTDTFLGRTFFYSIERIGRIGMLWNTAKHVIIYERTVVHTDQFKDKTSGQLWLGRPVMRKVREYVEILQPERNYPEFGEAPKIRGFVRASKFPQPIIYVDSAWGRDLPGGWIVPLYNPAADPTFYQSPDVKLKLTTSEKTAKLTNGERADEDKPKAVEQPFVWADITNPENLLFYTSTDPKTTRKTDDWPPAAGVDFPIAQIPTNEPPEGMADPDQFNVNKGYERYTLKIDTGKVPVNLLSERIDAVSDAVVENVCLVRRSLAALSANVKEPKEQVFKTLKIAEDLLHGGRQYETDLQMGVNKLAQVIGDKQNVQAIKETIGNLGKGVEGTLNNVLVKIKELQADQALFKNELITVLQNTQDRLKATWEREFDQAVSDVRRELGEMFREPLTDVQQMKRMADEAFQTLEFYVANVKTVLHEVEESAERARQLLHEVTVLEGNELTRRANLEALKKDLLKLAGGAQTTADQYRKAVVSALTRFEHELTAIKQLLSAFGNNLSEEIATSYEQFFKALLPANLKFPLTTPQLKALEQAANDAFTIFRNSVEAFRSKLDPSSAKCVFKETIERVKSLKASAQNHLTLLGEQKNRLKKIIETSAPKELQAKVDAFLKGEFATALGKIRGIVTQETFDKVKDDLLSTTSQIKDEVRRLFGQVESLQKDVEAQRDRARARAMQVLEQLGGELSDDVRRAYQEFAASVAGPLTEALAPYQRWVKEVDLHNIQNLPQQFKKEVESYGANTLRLVRAHGLAPIGEAIKLSDERLAYYFHEAERVGGKITDAVRQLENAVDISPSDVLLNGAKGFRKPVEGAVKDALKSVGITLPTKRIAERFLPDNEFMELLKRPRLKDIIGDFAGIDLEAIFSDTPFPIGNSEAIKITHGIDPSTFRPFAQADVAMQLAGDTTVFNIGPLMVNIVGAFFKARTRMAADPGGGVKREVQASIKADWRLTIAGQRVMTIKNSTLNFDDTGKIKFDMGAKDVELAEVLRFITDLLGTVGGGDKSGLSFELVRQGVLPVGARATLKLSLPALQTGAFSVSNIALNAFFELMLADGQFQLAVGLGVSSKERPFNLSILCLGGGGWLTVRALYRPMAAAGQKFAGMVSIGISAGASLPFDIGVASGGVFFFVSVGVEFIVGGGQGSLTMLLRVSVMGEVCVLGIISIGILIALEARYGNGSLVCTGELRVKIKICWCFTLSVSTSFTMQLAGSSGGSSADKMLAPPSIEQCVKNYMESFGD